ASFHLKALSVQIECRAPGASEHPLADPLAQGRLGGAVAVGITAKLKAHHVVGALLVKIALLILADNVIGRSDDARKIAHRALVVEQTVKWFYARSQGIHSNASCASAAAIWRSVTAPARRIRH